MAPPVCRGKMVLQGVMPSTSMLVLGSGADAPSCSSDHMEPQNHWLVEDNHLPGGYCQGSCSLSEVDKLVQICVKSTFI